MPSLVVEVAAFQLPMLRSAQDIGWKGFAKSLQMKRYRLG